MENNSMVQINSNVYQNITKNGPESNDVIWRSIPEGSSGDLFRIFLFSISAFMLHLALIFLISYQNFQHVLVILHRILI